MLREAISADRLREMLVYDQDTGIFRRKSQHHSVVGGIVGWDNGVGYLKTMIGKKNYYLHRLAWLYVYGRWPVAQLDHVNGVKNDNRIANLREAAPSENAWNVRRRADNQTGIKGVTLHPCGKWQAQIGFNGRIQYIGSFNTPEEAIAARSAAAKELHGNFANDG